MGYLPFDWQYDLIWYPHLHYGDVIMGVIASQTTSLTIVYSTVYSDADQRKHQSSASLAFVRGIHRGPVNTPHIWPVTRKMFPFDDVIMKWSILLLYTGLFWPRQQTRKHKFDSSMWHIVNCVTGEQWGSFTQKSNLTWFSVINNAACVKAIL